MPRERLHRKPRRTEGALPAFARGIEQATPVDVPLEPPETEGEWEAELPPPTPEDLATAQAHAIAVTTPDEREIDLLWDWIRQDNDRGASFLGVMPETSRELHGLMSSAGTWAIVEESLKANEAPETIGFVRVGIGPLGPTVALIAIYLAQSVRGRLQSLVPRLLELATEHYPEVQKFTVLTDDEVRARLYRQVGFELTYLLTWTPGSIIEPEVPDEQGQDETPGEETLGDA